MDPQFVETAMSEATHQLEHQRDESKATQSFQQPLVKGCTWSL